jgi:hypothetical protein
MVTRFIYLDIGFLLSAEDDDIALALATGINDVSDYIDTLTMLKPNTDLLGLFLGLYFPTKTGIIRIWISKIRPF